MRHQICIGIEGTNSGGAELKIAVGMGTISLVSVLLRLYYRYKITLEVGLDDWAILVAAVRILVIEGYIDTRS